MERTYIAMSPISQGNERHCRRCKRRSARHQCYSQAPEWLVLWTKFECHLSCIVFSVLHDHLATRLQAPQLTSCQHRDRQHFCYHAWSSQQIKPEHGTDMLELCDLRSSSPSSPAYTFRSKCSMTSRSRCKRSGM